MEIDFETPLCLNAQIDRQELSFLLRLIESLPGRFGAGKKFSWPRFIKPSHSQVCLIRMHNLTLMHKNEGGSYASHSEKKK